MMAELVRNDTRQLVVVESVEGEGTDNKDVSAARKCVDVVALVDRENEPSSWCAGGSDDDACCRAETSQFVRVGCAHAEQTREKNSLSEGNEHDNRPECNDAHEACERRIERNRYDEPDERRGCEPRR